MKFYEILKKFLHKAKQEAAAEYSISEAAVKSINATENDKAAAAKPGWIGMDLDGTLAYADTLSGTSKIGPPVPRMVELLSELMREGYRIKIFTARATDSQQIGMILKWLKDNGLPEMEVTNMKDFEMICLYDDRAIQVITNTGQLVELPPHQ